MVGTRAEALDRPLGPGERVLRGHSRSKVRLLPFLGPAFIACVAYIDPGNFATNIAGGSKFGFTLLWVIVASNLMAMLIQMLSAKLGIATGRNLPEVCREQFSRRTTMGLWLQAEAIAMATDLAEFLGAAIGFHLLLGIGLFPAAIMTAIAAFLILGLQRFGFRPLEAVIAAIVGLIGVCYRGELFMAHPPWGTVGIHAIKPEFQGSESVLLAVGILGATVMPHVIYLHSALTQHRVVGTSDEEKRRIFRFELVDVVIAMGIAGIVNMSMLIIAAAVFHEQGLTDVGDDLVQVADQLEAQLGGHANLLFGVALLASGLSSSSVGTLAGQVVMQGFIRRRIPLFLRRAITMAPALIVIAVGLDPSRSLVLSQVVLSFGIPFALIPLLLFCRDKGLMGSLVNHRVTTIIATGVIAVIVSLNVFLITLLVTGK